MDYDFNILERIASALKDQGRYRDALRVYFYMAEGDPSLDGGYLGSRIGECYECVGELDDARYWYSREAEESASRSSEGAIRLGPISIEDLCGPESSTA